MHNAARYIMGAFAGAAIVSGVGIAVAVASDSPEEPRSSAPVTLSQETPVDGFLARLATKLGVSEEELRAAIEETLREEIEQAADDGVLPEDFANGLLDRLEDGTWDEPFATGDLFGEDSGLPLLPGLEGLEGDLEELKQRVAEFLGTTEAEIDEALRDGESLGDIAGRFNKTPEEIGNFLLTEYLELLENEDIPQEVRDGMRDLLSRLIDMYVDGKLTLEGLFDGEFPGFDSTP